MTKNLSPLILRFYSKRVDKVRYLGKDGIAQGSYLRQRKYLYGGISLEYLCKCGKIFYNPQSFNAHKSMCKVHLGPERYKEALEVRLKAREKGYKTLVSKKHERIKKWIAEEHHCEVCGKIMVEKYGSGRFCSKECSRTYSSNCNTPESIMKRAKPHITPHGIYKGIKFDSSWELAFIVYHLDQGLDIHRWETVNFGKSLTYSLNGRKRNYFPDFVVNGRVYEIKGSYKDKDRAKARDNPGIIFIRGRKQMKPYLDYCISKYGKDFVKKLGEL